MLRRVRKGDVKKNLQNSFLKFLSLEYNVKVFNLNNLLGSLC